MRWNFIEGGEILIMGKKICVGEIRRSKNL